MLDRADGVAGELVLRRRGRVHELLIDGIFAMSDHLDGASERRQVDLTLAAAGSGDRLLLGGLGLGLALHQAVATTAATRITVVELEPTIVAWHRTHLRGLTEDALTDPRVELRVGDVADVLGATEARFDAIVLDVDNGPDWLIRPDNARLYQPAFLDLVATRLAADGAISVWGAGHDPSLTTGLRARFQRVEEHRIEVPRGEPDHLWIAAGPRRSPPSRGGSGASRAQASPPSSASSSRSAAA